jgi:hypothetical protein
MALRQDQQDYKDQKEPYHLPRLCFLFVFIRVHSCSFVVQSGVYLQPFFSVSQTVTALTDSPRE